MHSRLLGSILLITGTSIGAGMIGLPIAAAQLGFGGSLILLFLSWFVTFAGASLILEVNLWLPQNNNLISMAKATIGPVGQVIAWLTYLLLLYSLLCAYIAGGSDLFRNLLMMIKLDIPMWIASIIFTLVFGTVVYFGISSVDKANRVLMTAKFSSYFCVIFFLIPFISSNKLAMSDLHYLTSVSAITVTMTAFGWAILIPSLRVYFHGDIKKIKTAMFIGSLVPLICYILWDAVIMGVIPLTGKNSLELILHSANSTSSLVDTISAIVEKSSVTFSIKFFTSVCILTSFLGVSLCLADFFSDGLQLEKKGMNSILIHALTFLPALAIAIFFPNVFIKALEYAGIYATILLILLPAWMAWRGRYHRSIAMNEFQVRGGKFFLGLLILSSLVFIVRGIAN